MSELDNHQYLDNHQRSILIAILQNKRIEYCNGHDNDVEWFHCENPLNWINGYADQLRVVPNQDEAVRLYGESSDPESESIYFGDKQNKRTECYIDISPNGFIVGGKIEETK